MVGWIVEWMDEYRRMGVGWVDGWVDSWIDRCVFPLMGVWVDKYMSVWINGCLGV